MPNPEYVHQRFAPSKIYESPDGECCLEKTKETAQNAFHVASFFAVGEMLCASRPQGIKAKMFRYFYWVTPAVCIGATFAGTGCLLGQLRGKDDFINHGLAGAASASFFGMRYGFAVGVRWMIPMAGLAGLYKFAKQCGVEFFPDKKPIIHEMGEFDHYRSHIGQRSPVKEPTNY